MKIKTSYQYALFGMGTLALFLFCFCRNEGVTVRQVQLLMQCLLFGGVCLLYWVSKKRGFSYRYLVSFLIFAGFVMRVGYMLYTPAAVRSHDFGSLEKNSYGHFRYIYTIYSTGRLPDTNRVQMYHPPLYYALSAVCMRLLQLLTGVTEPERLVEAAKLVSCAASCITLTTSKALCRELLLGDRATAVVLALLAFLPNFYLLAGRVNNDSLVICFMGLILLQTIRWYRDCSRKNTILLALFFGFGMMTKISCAVLAFFTGAVMLAALWRDAKLGSVRNWLKQILLFGCIAIPFGMWYPIRNLLRFQQSLYYVPTPADVNSRLYVGNVSLWDRFFLIPLRNLFSPLYNSPWEDWNVELYLWKGSLFGEFSFSIISWIPKLLLLLRGVLLLLSLVALAVCAFRSLFEVIKRTDKDRARQAFFRLGLVLVWGLTICSYLAFNLKLPFGCTMDYRYIVMAAIVEAVLLGDSLEQTWKGQRIWTAAVILATVAFSVVSVVMFTKIG